MVKTGKIKVTIMKKCVSILKWIGLGVGLALMFGIAGQSDYEDAVIQEMKNSGAYYELERAHPTWNEKQLVEAYEAQRDGKQMDE